jgi:hypothetical protein
VIFEDEFDDEEPSDVLFFFIFNFFLLVGLAVAKVVVMIGVFLVRLFCELFRSSIDRSLDKE